MQQINTHIAKLDIQWVPLCLFEMGESVKCVFLVYEYIIIIRRIKHTWYNFLVII